MANQSISGIPEGLDQKLVKQVARGKKWGDSDQHRYDIASGAKLGQKGGREMRGDGEGLRTNYAQFQEKKDQGVEFSQRAQGMYDRMGDRIQRQDAKRAAAKERTTNFAAQPKTARG